ncbi:PREDICTED: uncharacterized protein LOC109215551 [Nicotiana attenuata]|uniref:uncharacterized protein LOC109215551 n=1 Tax=Nicotiana attenuata TaxID=49451 RepID=UPI0009056561|nr:PREDICTED: uncharacterized protein LOC109215551 [Nicotiana attenuata]
MACIGILSYSMLINGKPSVPFEARKGIRQEDPLSPFLFVLEMEYLSRSLKTLKDNKQFRFYLRCAKFNLVQLGFVDDLLLFCRGDILSVQILHKHFQLFSAASGLIANLNKSCIYFGSVNNMLHQQNMDILGYIKGELPFIYLGVPLSTKRLSAIHCEPLIERMLRRIQSWTTKFLSYAGRAVAGGLNFINVKLRNKAAICKLLWSICTRKEKLWVHWVHTYYIKGNTVWNIEPKNASWAIQKIFKARNYFENARLSEEDVQKMVNALSNNYTKPCTENFQR